MKDKKIKDKGWKIKKLSPLEDGLFNPKNIAGMIPSTSSGRFLSPL